MNEYTGQISLLPLCGRGGGKADFLSGEKRSFLSKKNPSRPKLLAKSDIPQIIPRTNPQGIVINRVIHIIHSFIHPQGVWAVLEVVGCG